MVVALLCALTAGAAALALLGRRARGAPGARTRALPALASAWRRPGAGRGELLRDNPLTRAVTRVALVGLRSSVRAACCCVGLALAALGWGLDTQTQVETDITKLVPQSLSSLQAWTRSSARPAWAARST